MNPSVRRLDVLDARLVAELVDILCACVEAGASVSFMAPLARPKAEAFWHDVAASVTRGERVLIVAADEHGVIVGTVQVIWAEPENQPHRADVAKMLVAPHSRRRALSTLLLVAAEREASAHDKTLLVLDTTDATAARLTCASAGRSAARFPTTRCARWAVTAQRKCSSNRCADRVT